MQKMTNAPAGVTFSGTDSISAALTPNSDSVEKVVKVVIGGFSEGEGSIDQNIFFVIPGRDTNAENGNLYQHSIYFCDGSTATGKEVATIKKNLSYIISSINRNMWFTEELFASSISSKITIDSNGRLIFDPSSEKLITMESTGGFCEYIKGEMTLNNGKILQKTLEACGDFGERAAVTAMRYTGNSVDTLRFQEGGSKDAFGTFITEFRDTRYVSAPDNVEFNEDLATVNLEEDEFYTTLPVIDPDAFQTFDCDREDADVTINMDFSNPELAEHTAGCETRGLDNMDFCRGDEAVSGAEQAAYGMCLG